MNETLRSPAASDSPAARRKAAVRAAAERLAPDMDMWQGKNAYFHAQDRAYMRFLVPPGRRVLELGCGPGALLASLSPGEGVGVDFSERMIEQARTRFPDLDFIVGDVEDERLIDRLAERPFDVIVMADTIGVLEDVQRTFAAIQRLCSADTRIIIAYHAALWEPLLRLAEGLGQKMPTLSQNWLSTDDIAALMDLAGFQEVKREWRILLPRRWLGLGPLINRFVATLPFIRRLCVRNYMVFRSRRAAPTVGSKRPTASIIIPCRNERGNIEAAVRRMPAFAPWQELIFIEGHSRDGTLAEIERVAAAYPERNIRFAVQQGTGKGDAVRQGFAMARGEVLMILDADLTMPPEELPKYYELVADGRGEFINGTRLVYPMEAGAMQFLNFIANRTFALLFSFMLNQRLTDTLCGTKAIAGAHYARLAEGRGYFGDFDPFGDFDLIFGAAKLNLKLVEVPVRYGARAYGETQISRFRHGWLLLRMIVFAWWKLKAI